MTQRLVTIGRVAPLVAAFICSATLPACTPPVRMWQEILYVASPDGHVMVPQGMKAISSGGVVIWGVVPDEEGAWVLETDRSGHVVSRMDRARVSYQDATPLPDGSVVLCGTARDGETGPESFLATHLSSDGAWVRDVVFGSPQDPKSADLRINACLESGDHLIVATEPVKGAAASFLMGLDSADRVSWRAHLPLAPVGAWGSKIELAQAPNGRDVVILVSDYAKSRILYADQEGRLHASHAFSGGSGLVGVNKTGQIVIWRRPTLVSTDFKVTHLDTNLIFRPNTIMARPRHLDDLCHVYPGTKYFLMLGSAEKIYSADPHIILFDRNLAEQNRIALTAPGLDSPGCGVGTLLRQDPNEYLFAFPVLTFPRTLGALLRPWVRNGLALVHVDIGPLQASSAPAGRRSGARDEHASARELAVWHSHGEEQGQAVLQSHTPWQEGRTPVRPLA